MATPTKAPAQTTPKVEFNTRKFTVEEYYRMAEVGILLSSERVELICGEIVPMAPIGKPHAVTLRRLDRMLQRELEGIAFVSAQNPIHLSQNSEPEPDVAVLRIRKDEYLEEHPEPGDILWIVEVSDTTLSFDRLVKTVLYAQAGIAEAWIMNLPEDCIEVFTEPGTEGYAQLAVYRRGDRVSPSTVADVEFAVEDLLPPVSVSNDSGNQGEGEPGH